MTVTRDARMIDKVTRVVNLYDLYGDLLTGRQRELVEMYYFEDWSLAEIAEHLGISRQAVHDNIRRAEEQLEAYERALGLLALQVRHGKLWLEVQRLWHEVEHHIPEPQRSRMGTLLSDMFEAIGEERGETDA